MNLIQGVKVKDVAKYTLLPGIVPRVNAFIESGFGWLAFLMAIIYNSVRLLPAGHPYLNPQNMGKYGIRHVIAEAANNLVISKENIDQLIIFCALLLGFVLLVLQFVAVIWGLIVSTADAAGLFSTPGCVAVASACPDIAHMMLDKVFAVPDLFNSSFAPASAGFPGNIPPFNRGLQELFQYYSNAMLIVALVILLYYVVVIVGETATTGTPFGRRFNHIYAPLRLVFAIGLLVPINYGYNSGQYITLLAARMGSGFATNGWTVFNAALAPNETTMGTRKESLVARPNIPDLTYLAAFISIVQTCQTAYEESFITPPNQKIIDAYLVKSDGTPPMLLPGSYANALAYYNNQDIVIRFGHLLPAAAEYAYASNVEPLCGEITIHTTVPGADAAGTAPTDQRIGAYRVQEAYYRIVRNLWNLNTDLIEFGEKMTSIYVGIPADPTTVGPGLPGDPNLPPDSSFKSTVSTNVAGMFEPLLVTAYNQMVGLAGGLYDITPAILARGWAGAAIWYNKIADWNGMLFGAVVQTPTPSMMPRVMKDIQEFRRNNDENVDSENRYCPTVQGLRPVENVHDKELPIAVALCEAYKYWMTDGKGLPTEAQPKTNVFIDLLDSVFGIGGLFTMRTNDDIHPLAQLSALGKSIVESSIKNLMSALVASAGGGAGEILGSHIGPALNAASSMFVAFASIGLTIGFILYYILPFMPFIYFFFAVGSWLKTIFEAMVGVPLWALAHMRIDGNGFPGESASNGYFLIFEIFIRPILTVFGLVAAMGIFSAMARTLNGVFDLVVENLAGFDCSTCSTASIAGIEYKRNAIDEFFFTIIYTVLVYMLAMSSFKLIDQIPHSILRWMGAGVQTFSDQAGDPAEGMVQYAAIGGSQITQQMAGALQQGARAGGQAGGAAAKGAFGLFSRNQGHVGIGGGKSSAGLSGKPPVP